MKGARFQVRERREDCYEKNTDLHSVTGDAVHCFFSDRDTYSAGFGGGTLGKGEYGRGNRSDHGGEL